MKKHSANCEACDKWTPRTYMTYCSCGKNVCCESRCATCGDVVCSKCRQWCKHCRYVYCAECAKYKCVDHCVVLSGPVIIVPQDRTQFHECISLQGSAKTEEDIATDAESDAEAEA